MWLPKCTKPEGLWTPAKVIIKHESILYIQEDFTFMLLPSVTAGSCDL